MVGGPKSLNRDYVRRLTRLVKYVQVNHHLIQGGLCPVVGLDLLCIDGMNTSFARHNHGRRES
jgi:hypothetical protein